MLSLLIDCTLKATALLALAFALAGLFRRASAAPRHLYWCCVLVGLLVLPGLAVLLPGWHILPRWDGPAASRPVAMPTVEAAPSAAPGADLPTLTGSPMSPEPVVPARAPAADPLAVARVPMSASVPAPPSRAPAPTPASVAPRFAWPSWDVLLTWTYLIGLCAALFPVAMAYLLLARLSRGTDLPEWSPLLDELRATIGVKRKVVLIRGHLPSMPLTWGFLRPVILLPRNAGDWPEERRRCVLLHELAHIRRHDALSFLLARLACAVYWFHPLAWLAAARLRAASELACDDMVLAAGTKSSTYAAELVTLAESSAASRVAPYAAIAMARVNKPSQLHTRVKAILDTTRRRGRLTLTAALAGVLLAAGLLLPVACMKMRLPAMASADVEWHVDPAGNYSNADARRLTLTNASDMERLTAHFPGLGERREASGAGGWIASVAITFHHADGSTVHVNVNPELTHWSEGNGDWDVRGDLRKTLESLPWAAGSPATAAGAAPMPAAAIDDGPVTVWGETNDGVQLGLRLPKRKLVEGETAQATILARNVGKEPRTLWNQFQRPFGIQRFSNVVRITDSLVEFGSGTEDHRLAPGEEVELGSITIGGGSAWPGGPLRAGTYRVTAEHPVDLLNDAARSDHLVFRGAVTATNPATVLAAGEVTIEVVAPAKTEPGPGAAGDADVEWGPAAEGMQLRLTPGKSLWHIPEGVLMAGVPGMQYHFLGEEPALKLEVRNLSDMPLLVDPAAFLLEVDGTVRRQVRNARDNGAGKTVNPKEIATFDLPLVGRSGLPELGLAKHTLRVVHEGAGAGTVVSNAVTVQNYAAFEAWGKAVNGMQLGVRLAKDRFAEGEIINPEVILRNADKSPRFIWVHPGDFVGVKQTNDALLIDDLGAAMTNALDKQPKIDPGAELSVAKLNIGQPVGPESNPKIGDAAINGLGMKLPPGIYRLSARHAATIWDDATRMKFMATTTWQPLPPGTPLLSGEIKFEVAAAATRAAKSPVDGLVPSITPMLKAETTDVMPEFDTFYELAPGTTYHNAGAEPAEMDTERAWSAACEFVNRTALRKLYTLPAEEAGPRTDDYLAVFKSVGGAADLRAVVSRDFRMVKIVAPLPVAGETTKPAARGNDVGDLLAALRAALPKDWKLDSDTGTFTPRYWNKAGQGTQITITVPPPPGADTRPSKIGGGFVEHVWLMNAGYDGKPHVYGPNDPMPQKNPATLWGTCRGQGVICEEEPFGDLEDLLAVALTQTDAAWAQPGWSSTIRGLRARVVRPEVVVAAGDKIPVQLEIQNNTSAALSMQVFRPSFHVPELEPPEENVFFYTESRGTGPKTWGVLTQKDDARLLSASEAKRDLGIERPGKPDDPAQGVYRIDAHKTIRLAGQLPLAAPKAGNYHVAARVPTIDPETNRDLPPSEYLNLPEMTYVVADKPATAPAPR